MKVTQSCPTLCNPMDCSLLGSSVHGMARILEWVPISFSRGSSWPRDRTQVSHIAGRCFILWATGVVYNHSYNHSYYWQEKCTYQALHFSNLRIRLDTSTFISHSILIFTYDLLFVVETTKNKQTVSQSLDTSEKNVAQSNIEINKYFNTIVPVPFDI